MIFLIIIMAIPYFVWLLLAIFIWMWLRRKVSNVLLRALIFSIIFSPAPFPTEDILPLLGPVLLLPLWLIRLGPRPLNSDIVFLTLLSLGLLWVISVIIMNLTRSKRSAK